MSDRISFSRLLVKYNTYATTHKNAMRFGQWYMDNYCDPAYHDDELWNADYRKAHKIIFDMYVNNQWPLS